MFHLASKISEMLHIPKNVVDKVLEIKEKDSRKSSRDIVKSISRQLQYNITEEEVKNIRHQCKILLKHGQEQLQELNNNIKSEPKYETDGSNYIVYGKISTKDGIKKERYTLPIELVDRIFNDYSRHGKNLSSQAIQHKYKLRPNVWNLIKSNIGLYKDSNILSPLSMDIASGKGNIDEVIEEATYQNFNDKYKDKYHEAHITNLEKIVKKQARILGTIEGFLTQIEPIINSIKPIHIEAKKLTGTKDNPMYVFADPHLGKKYTDLVIKRLEYMTADIIAHPSKMVTIVCLGDIFEALMQGGMHSGQIESMHGIYGADLFMYGVEVFVGFLKKILESGKTIEFVGIGGNHDRISIENKHDNERMFATIFYEMLKAYLQKADIQFNIIRKNGVIFDWNDTKVLPLHEGIEKKNPESVAWKYGDTDKHMLILSAHEHNEQVYTGRNVTHYKVNAMAGANEYDERIGKFSYPGYAVFQKNEHGIPNFTSKRLP